MKQQVAIALVPLLAILGCSKTTDSLSEAQALATLQDCLVEVQGFEGKHKGYTVTAVGPIVSKGPTETEVSFKYKVDTREFAGEAQFVQDQAGKRYLKSLQISYDSCEFKLPLAVK